MKQEDIINYDFQGWPIYKLTLRLILKLLGLNERGDKLEIGINNPILDQYPITLLDDGMGYGVNEQYITDVDKSNGIKFWIDKKENK